jgi:hypothetical protein
MRNANRPRLQRVFAFRKLLTAVCNAILALLGEWEGMMTQNLMATVLRSSSILAGSLIAQSFLLLILFGGRRLGRSKGDLARQH